MKWTQVQRAFAVALLLLACGRPSVGQAVYGNIIGTVSDPSGATVPNAAVVILDLDRGVSYQATTTRVVTLNRHIFLPGITR